MANNNKNVGRSKKIEEVSKIEENNIVENTIDNEKEELLKKNKEQEELINSLKNQNKESMSALEILQKQMQDMQNAFIKMQSNTSSNFVDNSNEKFELSCRLINGVALYSPKREVEINVPYGKSVEINKYEIEMLLKTQFVREFLVKDVVYFINKEDYERCKIFDHMDMSDETLVNMLLNYDSNTLISEFNKLTREKKDDPVMHSLFYRIVEKYSDGEIARMTYQNRKAIETYFKFSIDSAQMLIDNLKKVQ